MEITKATIPKWMEAQVEEAQTFLAMAGRPRACHYGVEVKKIEARGATHRLKIRAERTRFLELKEQERAYKRRLAGDMFTDQERDAHE